MAEDVIIPLSWANNIPGVSGVRDVEFSIPEPSDIDDVLDFPEPPTVDDIVDGIANELDDQLDNIGEGVARLRGDLPDIVQDAIDEADIAGDVVDEVVQAVEDTITDPLQATVDIEVDGSLFDLSSDFVAIIERAFEQADLGGVGEFPTLGELEDIIDEQTPDAPDGGIPGLDQIEAAVERAVETVLDDAGLIDFVTDPLSWLEDNLLDVTPDVDDDLQQRLDALREEEGE